MEDQPRMETREAKAGKPNHCSIQTHKINLVVPKLAMEATCELRNAKCRSYENANSCYKKC
jgi:hypothetical protein